MFGFGKKSEEIKKLKTKNIKDTQDLTNTIKKFNRILIREDVAFRIYKSLPQARNHI